MLRKVIITLSFIASADALRLDVSRRDALFKTAVASATLAVRVHRHHALRAVASVSDMR